MRTKKARQKIGKRKSRQRRLHGLGLGQGWVAPSGSNGAREVMFLLSSTKSWTLKMDSGNFLSGWEAVVL